MMCGLVVWSSGFCLIPSGGFGEVGSVWIWRSGTGFTSKTKVVLVGAEVQGEEVVCNQGIYSGKQDTSR